MSILSALITIRDLPLRPFKCGVLKRFSLECDERVVVLSFNPRPYTPIFITRTCDSMRPPTGLEAEGRRA